MIASYFAEEQESFLVVAIWSDRVPQHFIFRQVKFII